MTPTPPRGRWSPRASGCRWAWSRSCSSSGRRLGEIGPLHHRAGRKPRILPANREQFRRHLTAKPDLTLAELRAATGLDCTLPAIHYVLADMA